MRNLAEQVGYLPPQAQKEVRDFVDFLSQRYTSKPRTKKKLVFKWAGALAHLKDQYTSVELQHQISKWMAKEK